MAVVTALAHVIVTEKLYDEAFIRDRCDWDEFEEYAEFVSDVRHSPRDDGVADRRSGGGASRGGSALREPAETGAIYYGLGVTEHSQGSTTVMGIANLAMLTGNIGPRRRWGEPAQGPEQRAGAPATWGAFPMSCRAIAT